MEDLKKRDENPFDMLNKPEKESEILKPSIKQEQIHNILFNRELGWQEIIYDLINTEQLDPWDINIIILTESFLKKISELEEADFFVSSKVLLAAALLLRIKSEILLNKYIKSIDEILFGKTPQKKYSMERIELEEEIPSLIPRSPIPRYKKITLKELIESLNKAITTENRRIKKEIINSNSLRETAISLPTKTINIKDRLTAIYNKIISHLKSPEIKKKISFSELVGEREKLFSFYPLLQLENQHKVWLEQESHFEEIYVWLKHIYFKENPNHFADLMEDLETEITDDKNEKYENFDQESEDSLNQSQENQENEEKNISN